VALPVEETVGDGVIVAITAVLDGDTHPLNVASTKYEVVCAISGVTNVMPVPKEDPPVAEEYQFRSPPLATACNVTVPAPHFAAGITVITVGIVFTDATTGVLFTVVQPLNVAVT
jgi:hypothetical protein